MSTVSSYLNASDISGNKQLKKLVSVYWERMRNIRIRAMFYFSVEILGRDDIFSLSFFRCHFLAFLSQCNIVCVASSSEKEKNINFIIIIIYYYYCYYL